jgi:hypothetical protein
MASLSPELQQAIDARPDGPVRLVDERTQKEYVLLSAAEYERLLAADDVGLTPAELSALVDRTMAEYDAGDPLLESYQERS